MRTASARSVVQLVSSATWFCNLVLLSISTLQVESIAIDNEVIGLPLIQCTDQGVNFNVRTRLPFRGNIYIKGQFGVPTCRQEFYRNDAPGASFGVRIGDCGMRRGRQLQPLGMNYMLVFVVSFHPQFVTKVDRAYNVRCFYAQAEKTVNSELEVGQLNTETLEQATMIRPHCEYSIRAGTVDGPRVKFTNIGDQLVHRWECDNPNYGMLVKNCFVNDGGGATVRVLDERGCPVFSPVIQGTLSYDNSLNLAFVPVWAYKFPDRAQLYFQCQIQVCNKRENECVGVSPPNCPTVGRPDFIPNSVINAGVDPTQVVGTFAAGIPPVGPPQVAPIGPTVDPRLAIPPEIALGNPFTNPFVGPTSEALLATGGVRPGRPYRRHELNPNETTTMASTKRNPFQRQLQQRQMEEELREWNVDRMRDDLIRKAPLNRRLRKAEDETLDVIAEPVTVGDSEFTENSFDQQRVFRREPAHFGGEDVVCVNRVALGAIVVLFAFVSTTTLVMSLYIFYDYYSKRIHKKRTFDRQTIFGFVSSPIPHPANRLNPRTSVLSRASSASTSSSTTSSRPTPNHHPTYVLPERATLRN